MKYDSRYPWYLLDLAIFMGINIALLWYLQSKMHFGVAISPLYILLFGLAVYRGADVIANETITEPLRSPFVKIISKEGKEVEEPLHSGFKGSLGTLLYCPSCMGAWVSMVLVYSFLFWPSQTLVVVYILALSAIERIISRVLEYFKQK